MAEKEYTMQRLDGITLRRFGPRPAHMLEGICPLCEAIIEAGDWTTLVPFRPTDPDELKAMLDGKEFNAPTQEVHWTCASRLPL